LKDGKINPTLFTIVPSTEPTEAIATPQVKTSVAVYSTVADKVGALKVDGAADKLTALKDATCRAVAIKVKEGDSVKLQGTGLAVEEWFKGEA
jgi:hypothetical protein